LCPCLIVLNSGWSFSMLSIAFNKASVLYAKLNWEACFRNTLREDRTIYCCSIKSTVDIIIIDCFQFIFCDFMSFAYLLQFCFKFINWQNYFISSCHSPGKRGSIVDSTWSFSIDLISLSKPSTECFTGDIISRVSTSGRSWNRPPKRYCTFFCYKDF